MHFGTAMDEDNGSEFKEEEYVMNSVQVKS